MDAPLYNLDELKERRLRCHAEDQSVVWVNGCFDIIHAGHVRFLNDARSLGDNLFVGIQDDSTIRELKGYRRPIHKLEDRLSVIRAIRSVDAVMVLTELLPLKYISTLTPNIVCKDETYKARPLPERSYVEAYGGRMELLASYAGLSTSKVVEAADPSELRARHLDL